jgi:hypothetical protein
LDRVAAFVDGAMMRATQLDTIIRASLTSACPMNDMMKVAVVSMGTTRVYTRWISRV